MGALRSAARVAFGRAESLCYQGSARPKPGPFKDSFSRLCRASRMRAVLGLADAGGEALAAEGEGRDDGALDAHLGAVAGHAVILAQHPDGTGAVVKLEDSLAEQAVGVAHRAGDHDLFVHEVAGVAIDLGDGAMLRASSHQQDHSR